ncbi:alpha/beta hydrolase [Blastopirellula marina]|uniref:Xylanase n=1 Tax=Blastopirellula marina TaxID=124 RepID=A0A2S8FLJ0_9BACT|nr:alpha/beta hydrolase [Blastopirellula marina]PQO33021.1 xylanase [Blastopirellula marina]PTL43188.1 alpha/beta hydrolase [Blastopirellula marina]
MKSLLGSSCLFALLMVSSLSAAEPISEAIWPEGKVPGLAEGEKEEIVEVIDDRIGRKVTKVTKPTVTVYKPDPAKDTGAAVVICPGGGYHILAYDLEGTEVAAWLNEIGVTGVILHYRVPRAKEGEPYINPLKDAQRAIRLVRAHADDWKIDPNKIGILGFSAGGNLAAVTSNAQEATYEAVDKVDQLDPRPNFTLLIYPAYLNPEGKPTELTPQTAVHKDTPPAFLVHASNDPISSTGSAAYYFGLKQQGIPAELHIFPKGGHGYGLRPTEQRVTQWPKLASGWLLEEILVEPEKK